MRAAGILLSVTSLPSKYGIGCFSKSAYDFVDWLKAAGQTYWQILPLGPTGYGDSPYQSFSTFAGNPYMISLEELIDEGLLSKSECDAVDFGTNPAKVDYQKLYLNRYHLLRLAHKNDNVQNREDYIKFLDENSYWLDDYALFMAIKEAKNGKPIFEWDKNLITRDESTLESYRQSLCDDISFHKYLQYKFYSKWKKLKDYANKNGVYIIGDIPIYVAYDSADVWTNPKLFQLNDDLSPVSVAGCPPDGFSATGQLWGNPVYDWKYHRKTNYSWWIKRLKHCLKLYDIVRIDHFRGFESFYTIPFGEATAINGKWEKGPGAELFKCASDAIQKDKIIAEDLGYMTDSVRKMLAECGFPGMKVLQFAFDSRDTGSANDHLPHYYTRNSVVYTGTHDNQTIVSWYKSITDEERKNVMSYLYDNNFNSINKPMIALAMRSVADTCIIPMQDWLGLDDGSRMNIPSTMGKNWQWRLGSIPDSILATEIKNMTTVFGRI